METITLATLPNATAQQVFDYVVAHLRKQGRKSALGAIEREGGQASCQYRMTANDGTVLRCAAGCLIADSEYIAAREGSSWAYLSGVYDKADIIIPLKETRVPNQHALLIKSLQHVHDNIEIPLWEEHFERVAKENTLDYTPTESK